MQRPYTLAMYRVIPGREDEFIAAWSGLAKIFAALPSPPDWGTLIRSRSDRCLFYSFGPWQKAADVAEMRHNHEAIAAFQAIRSLCVEMTPGDYEVVTHVAVREEPRSSSAS